MEKNNIFLVILFYETTLAFARKWHRRQVYKQALKKSLETNRKLLVIGDPKNGIMNRLTGGDYGYGDECIDITGCPNAPNAVIRHKGLVEHILPRLLEADPDGYVIFQSCVFEYVDNFAPIRQCLENVPVQYLFFVQVQFYSIASYFYPGFIFGESSTPQRVFLKYPPKDTFMLSFTNPATKVNAYVFWFAIITVWWNVWRLFSLVRIFLKTRSARIV